MIIYAYQHFLMESRKVLFADHEQASNERVFEDDRQTKLIRHIADQHFTLRLFTYGTKWASVNKVNST